MRKRRKPTRAVREPVLAPDSPIAAGEFKARCLELMDQVKERHVEFVITKHGKPVARLVPVEEKPGTGFGSMKGTIEIVGDIISPVFDPDDFTWDADNI